MEEKLCEWFKGTFTPVHKRLKRPMRKMDIEPIKITSNGTEYDFNALFMFEEFGFIARWEEEMIKEIYMLKTIAKDRTLVFVDSSNLNEIKIKIKE